MDSKAGSTQGTSIARILFYLGSWYFFSSALSIYNKALLGKHQYNLNLPLLLCAIHAMTHFLTSLFLYNFFCMDLRRRPKPTVYHYLTHVVPTGLCTALDIVMSNASLHYISLSFYTMIKSSVPVWVLMFAFLFGLEKIRLSLIAIIMIIVFGVVITIAGEIKYDTLGLVLVLGGSIFSGLRWSLTQILLQGPSSPMGHPVLTLLYLSPVMAFFDGILSLVLEFGYGNAANHPQFASVGSIVDLVGLLAIGGVLAFLMTISEYFLIASTSVVTLSGRTHKIGTEDGMSKEVVVIVLSMIIFGDHVTMINVVGIIITIGGIALYNLYKYKNGSLGHHARRGPYSSVSSKDNELAIFDD
ncbi:triose-phosphate transporter family-domain-containing protein [Polychytrium aggregatum]|uniref:triose-phosphate transporter family-domain-containing protein n=1 Tax=Polychytrium aggregatum TaxID=110093 RepID=UPI0022FE6021|nr:triose-phosphate transporter family-domain-containing protein [Polychytrium aggregatum]KAI9199612.1 triose-phosphate transporter family-domain-containing protein [Polychytrium aggregatum]